jgi:hypothetical protein
VPRCPAENASVGDYDINASEMLMDLPHGFLDGIEMGDVAFQRQILAAREGLGNTLRCRQINVGQHHSRPTPSQCRGSGRAQSATASGNQDDLAEE